MSIEHPIIKPCQLKKPLVCEPMRAEWVDGQKDSWWSTHYAGKPDKKMEKLFPLRDKLLSFGGEQVCLSYIEEDFGDIMDRGQLFLGTGLRMRKGLPCQCHANSCGLWIANKGRCNIATGYALSIDGLWRQHSWVVQPLTVKYRVWETTVPRVAYFGFIMTDEECEKFCYENDVC